MIDLEHAKRVLAHQEEIATTSRDQLLIEMAERLIAMENKIARLDTRTKDTLDDFMRGAKNLSVRFDRLEAKIDTSK